MIKYIGSGYGKIIFFGEHFVVYGLPALVASLPLQTTAVVGDRHLGKEGFLDDSRPKVPTFQKTKTASIAYEKMAQRICSLLAVDHDNVSIKLGGDLPVTSGGIGASAAAAVAIARGVAKKVGCKKSNEALNHVAWLAEHHVHGNPSGIDNTAATFGEVFMFQKKSLASDVTRCESIVLAMPLRIVIADSGQPCDTKKTLAAVYGFLHGNARKKKIIFQKYKNLIQQAHESFAAGDILGISELMSENHDLLCEIGVSNPVLNRMVSVACDAGALGAKITGTGSGGIIVALVGNSLDQEGVSDSLKKEGWWTQKITIKANRKEKRMLMY